MKLTVTLVFLVAFALIVGVQSASQDGHDHHEHHQHEGKTFISGSQQPVE
uniref:Uncharacterized protein n=1 Tax=Octopus bimaculoides TaxID=37653 RepID=A0A0L8H5U5_OCTBM